MEVTNTSARPRIGLLTIHASDNYGSVLQAACLTSELSRFGDVTVIDHRPAILNIGYLLDIPPYQVLRRRVNREGWAFFRKHQRMLASRREMLPLGPHLLRRPAGDVFSNYDLLVVGSDEVWSSRWGNQPQFLFQNAPDQIPRISYAASLGRSEAIPGGQPAAEALSKFTTVLVRDGATAEGCDSMGRPADEIVCDPVMLVDPSVLRSLAGPSAGQSSTVLYLESCQADPRIARARELAHGSADIISVGFPSPGIPSEIQADTAGFLGRIANADLVVTSMFHGVVTALTLGKRVAILSQPNKRQKMEDLLQRVSADIVAEQDGITVVAAAPGIADFRARSRAALTAAVDRALGGSHS